MTCVILHNSLKVANLSAKDKKLTDSPIVRLHIVNFNLLHSPFLSKSGKIPPYIAIILKQQLKQINMETLKNVTVKMIGLLLMTTLSFSAMGQSSKTIELGSDRDDHMFRLYTSPLNLIDVSGGSVQLTAGKSLWKGGEVQLNYSTRLKSGNPFAAYNVATFFFFGLDAHYSKGYRVGAEIQQTIQRTKNMDFYLAAEFATAKEDITVSGAHFFLVEFETDHYTFTVDRKYFNGKFGMKWFVSDRVIVDTYIGFGRKFSNPEIDFEFGEEEENLSVISINRNTVPMNIKIGYQF